MTVVATGKRTFVLTLSLLQLKATNPRSIVDWGDGTDILSDAPLARTSFAKHIYEKSGIYTIKVTGFNQVSSKILNKTVSSHKNQQSFIFKNSYKKQSV